MRNSLIPTIIFVVLACVAVSIIIPIARRDASEQTAREILESVRESEEDAYELQKEESKTQSEVLDMTIADIIESAEESAFYAAESAYESYVESRNQAEADYEEEEPTYIINENTMRVHEPDCPSVKDISAKNKKYWYEDLDSALAEGYEPCSRCLAGAGNNE